MVISTPLVKWLTRGCSLAAGGVVFYLFGGELIASNPAPASSAFEHYIFLIIDLLVSFIGSAMLAYLFYFCVWDCAICLLIDALRGRKAPELGGEK
jgi:hypothetical protein